MISTKLTILNARGLHARAAAKFVETAEQFTCAIEVAKDDSTVSGSSIMGLMMLAASKGTEIEVSCEGVDEREAMNALSALVSAGFHEDLGAP